MTHSWKSHDFFLRLAPRAKMRAKDGFLLCGVAVALLLTRPVAAQTAASDLQSTVSSPSECDSLTPDTPHSDALRKVCQYAVTIPQRMPNFTCEQKASRYIDAEVADVITAHVTYEDGTESYQNVKLNGQPVTDARLLNSGTWSTGQFGGLLRDVFDTRNKVRFQFVNQSEIDGRRVLTFQYRVAHQDVPLWRLHVEDHVVAPPYHGRLWIDEGTGILLRLEVVASEIPTSFPISNTSLQIDYKNVPFDDGTTFVLPLEAVVDATDHQGKLIRNTLQFRNCHKFRATARIVPSD